jgi:hypothetical protein
MASSEFDGGLPWRPVRDVTPSRTRRSSSLYAETVRSFLESGETTAEFDLQQLDIKTPTLRAGLLKAVAEAGVEDSVEVSIRPSVGKAYLIRKG